MYRSASHLHFKKDRIVVGADESFIQRLQALYFQVGGNNESVDHIVLEVFFVSPLIRLVQRTAGGYIAVHQETEIAAEFIYEQGENANEKNENRLHDGTAGGKY